MLRATHDGQWVVRFADGEDLMSSLLSPPIDAGFLPAGIGMLRDLRLGYWNGKAYETTDVANPVELLAMQGNFGRSESQRVVHRHVAVATRDGTSLEGHLVRARVHNTVEPLASETRGIALHRQQEPTGLARLRPRAT